jgi:hypothetical protein
MGTWLMRGVAEVKRLIGIKFLRQQLAALSGDVDAHVAVLAENGLREQVAGLLLASGRGEEAVCVHRAEFERRTLHQDYSRLRDTAERAGQWPGLREWALEYLGAGNAARHRSSPSWTRRSRRRRTELATQPGHSGCGEVVPRSLLVRERLPPAASLTVRFRHAQPVQSAFAAVTEHPSLPDWRSAPCICVWLPELVSPQGNSSGCPLRRRPTGATEILGRLPGLSRTRHAAGQEAGLHARTFRRSVPRVPPGTCLASEADEGS